MLDDGYNVPRGYAGRVLMGMGLGPYLGTHTKPLPVSTRDLYINGGFSKKGKYRGLVVLVGGFGEWWHS